LSPYVLLSLIVLGGLLLAEQKKWPFKRQGLFDRVIKGRLRALKERKAFIHLAFGVVRLVLPLLLIVTCFLPGTVPRYLAVPCAIAGAAVAFCRFAANGWEKWVLVTVLYLFSPFIVFLAEAHRQFWFLDGWAKVYNAAYLVLVLCVVLTLKWTKRREGFRVTPMDFLILFIVFAVSLLPGEYARQYHLGTIAARIVTFFFAFEVLIGELRGELRPSMTPNEALRRWRQPAETSRGMLLSMPLFLSHPAFDGLYNYGFRVIAKRRPRHE
jgi:UDP-GlcNAc:undecaprenyl-phosphate/decaprenyl-phosphate GlcNAc-1-phosphate transferase